MADSDQCLKVKKKISKGRQKIEIKKIENTNYRQVAFSKRRAGIFKKAGEISVLSGAKVAIVTFSEGGRVYSFGNPNAEAVIDHYLSGYNNGLFSDSLDEEISENFSLNKDCDEAIKELDDEKNKGNLIENNKNGDNGDLWLDLPMEKMSLKDLEEYTEYLMELKSKMDSRINDLLMNEAENFSNNFLPPFSNDLPSATATATAAMNTHADFGHSSNNSSPPFSNDLPLVAATATVAMNTQTDFDDSWNNLLMPTFSIDQAMAAVSHGDFEETPAWWINGCSNDTTFSPQELFEFDEDFFHGF